MDHMAMDRLVPVPHEIAVDVRLTGRVRLVGILAAGGWRRCSWSVGRPLGLVGGGR